MRARLIAGLGGAVAFAPALGFWYCRSHLLTPPPECHAAGWVAAGPGGAAIAADILSTHPAVAEGAVLVSCPCDVARWRDHMLQTQGGDIWREPITSISPRDVTAGINPHARITIVVGDRDDTVPPDINEKYYEQLKARGLNAELVHVPGGGHDIFFESAVRDAVRQWLK